MLCDGHLRRGVFTTALTIPYCPPEKAAGPPPPFGHCVMPRFFLQHGRGKWHFYPSLCQTVGLLRRLCVPLARFTHLGSALECVTPTLRCVTRCSCHLCGDHAHHPVLIYPPGTHSLKRMQLFDCFIKKKSFSYKPHFFLMALIFFLLS